VVRHLTRRLERLRGGMAAFGAGDLSRRVPVEGRDEVATVARAFNHAAERIERLVESNRSLLANASHELRSPLARMRMAADLHVQSPTEATRGEILRNVAELDMLVEEILLASRLDHAERTAQREAIDLLALAAEEAARHEGVGVEGQSAELRGDPVLLTRLVRNLIQNAERHGAPPVSVTVARLPTGGVELAVRDHGPGIATAEMARIFEPFYRPAGRGEAAGGWGLGLALVRQIAEHHGASVACEAPEGGGARFVVRFPAT
jgi:signal transduction histidine kinase